MILGQNPGELEEKEGKPFVGKTGQMMESKFLPLAGLNRDQCSVGNAIRCRVNDSNDLPQLDGEEPRKAVEHCTRAHLRVPESTKLVITQGAYALYAATGHGANKNDRVSDWRGWALPYSPIRRGGQISPALYTPRYGEGLVVLATYHLAAIFRDPTLQHPTKHDWSRVAKFMAGKWPEKLPAIHFDPPTKLPAQFAMDTEFVPATRQLIRYSLAWRDKDGTPQVYVVDGDHPNWLPVEQRPTIIFHHTGADQDYADELIPGGAYDIEDTMHAHAVLWSDLDHDLGFLGSIYGRINRWKHLEYVSPLVYSGADALVTYDVWTDWMKPQLDRDTQSDWIYRNLQLRLIPVIRKARQFGLKVNKGHTQEALVALEARCGDAEAMAQAAVGWPMNLGSGPQVVKQLYEVEKVHLQARKGAPRK
jgi:DNA polymerase